MAIINWIESNYKHVRDDYVTNNGWESEREKERVKDRVRGQVSTQNTRNPIKCERNKGKF